MYQMITLTEFLTNSLKANHILWFSYENKQNRDIKVKIKNLHHSYQPMNILRSFNDQGLQTLNATPRLKWKTKEPLDMFIVSFHRNKDMKKSSILKQFAEQLSLLNQSNKLRGL
jgi:hypothetical protein